MWNFFIFLIKFVLQFTEYKITFCGLVGSGRMGDWGHYCRGVKNLLLSITVISCGTETETVCPTCFLLEKENIYS